MTDLIDYINGIPKYYWEDILDILKTLREDPGLLYHKYSLIYSKYRWPLSFYRPLRPPLIKKVKGKEISLIKPDPNLINKPLSKVLIYRRSIRHFKKEALSLLELSTLMFYSFGVKGSKYGYPIRMFPSAGALQPIEPYLIIENVEEIEQGIYHYNAYNHSLTLIKKGSYQQKIYEYSLMQEHVKDAPMNIVLTLVYNRTASKYGFRSYRYALLDVGHVGMNIYLVSTAMKLGTCAVGAFEDDKIIELLDLKDKYEFPIMIYPVGKPNVYPMK